MRDKQKARYKTVFFKSVYKRLSIKLMTLWNENQFIPAPACIRTDLFLIVLTVLCSNMGPIALAVFFRPGSIQAVRMSYMFCLDLLICRGLFGSFRVDFPNDGCHICV